MPKAKAKQADLSSKVLAYLRAKEAGKRAYARADRLLDEISLEVVPGVKVALNDSGRHALLVDQFADKSIVWKPCGVRRFDLKVIEP